MMTPEETKFVELSANMTKLSPETIAAIKKDLGCEEDTEEDDTETETPNTGSAMVMKIKKGGGDPRAAILMGIKQLADTIAKQ